MEENTPQSNKGFGDILRDLCGVIKSKFVSAGDGGGSGSWFKDFCAFKIMILPVIITALWTFLTFVSLLVCIVMCVKCFADGSVLSGIVALVILPFIPFLTHIIFEFFMLGFSILNILKEIRDQLKK